MPYRLLAMDMDGTVLNSQKIITHRTEQAIRTALAAGKEVLFATGRCPSEVREYLDRFPEMRYALCLSGALIFDVAQNKTLASRSMSRELAGTILAAADGMEAMMAIYAGDNVYVERRQRRNMAYFGCDSFSALYDRCAFWVDDLPEALERIEDPVYKINFYCHAHADWEKMGRCMSGLPVSYARGIPNNFEISPEGVDKGVGLQMLCQAANIPISEAIAVGDEGNDLAMVKAAGLGVAMGNASDAVKAVANEITADCDHDGVADVIEKYLL